MEIVIWGVVNMNNLQDIQKKILREGKEKVFDIIYPFEDWLPNTSLEERQEILGKVEDINCLFSKSLEDYGKAVEEEIKLKYFQKLMGFPLDTEPIDGEQIAIEKSGWDAEIAQKLHWWRFFKNILSQLQTERKK